jgi:alpha-L-arabinofuranosidase
MKTHGIFVRTFALSTLFLVLSVTVVAQKRISSDLFGLFFEDINYAADGGLYAEMVQNRSFEYNPGEQPTWNPFSFWQMVTTASSYGTLNVETNQPLHPNNPHYVVLSAEYVRPDGGSVGLRNAGFNGMSLRAGDQYLFSIQLRALSQTPVSLQVSVQDEKGSVLAQASVQATSNDWKRYTANLVPTRDCANATLVVAATQVGKVALDMVSLFPEKTFKNRPNGLRADMAQMLADLKPRFLRFPGGCLAHGDGLYNMYRWKNTIGPVETRHEQRNIWGYNQTAGLGYFEYFQFCEDIGAKPLPVLPAGVCCQNAGNSRGRGQQALPMEQMDAYVQEVLDLIEWANGPATSTWGAKRAAAGHPAPFHLQYVGIGNEDAITPDFEARFRMIYAAVKVKYPEITLIGTVGPMPDGSDFEKGWKLAEALRIPIVDEHYYCQPDWFLEHQNRYDAYRRNGTQVYLGEYASWGNTLYNALAEAAYMTSLERNGDVVRMASYAPLLAKIGNTQWSTDLIFFDNQKLYPSVNYYVQKMFGANQGDWYYDNVVRMEKSKLLAASCVKDSKSGDVILKLVNVDTQSHIMHINLKACGRLSDQATLSVLKGEAKASNAWNLGQNVVPQETTARLKTVFDQTLPPLSLTVIRIAANR